MTNALRGAVAQALQTRFGGPVVPKFSTVTVGTSQTLLVPSNMDRVALAFMNFGANDAVLNFDPRVTITRGILCRATVGYVSLDIYEDTVLPAWEWYGIASVAVELTIMETVREIQREAETR